MDPVRSKFGTISRDEIKLEDRMVEIRKEIRGLAASISEPYWEESGRMNLIVSFLAILELMKTGVITIRQEELSIVAYKQPVTRQEIEKIRGVSCSHAVNRLVEYNLIQEVGRLDAPGHPILFGTTDDFLRSFGISSMDDLPVITPDRLEDFRRQAEEEAGVINVET